MARDTGTDRDRDRDWGNSSRLLAALFTALGAWGIGRMTARGASPGRGSHGMILHEIMWRTSGRAEPCGGPLVVEQSFGTANASECSGSLHSIGIYLG